MCSQSQINKMLAETRTNLWIYKQFGKYGFEGITESKELIWNLLNCIENKILHKKNHEELSINFVDIYDRLCLPSVLESPEEGIKVINEILQSFPLDDYGSDDQDKLEAMKPILKFLIMEIKGCKSFTKAKRYLHVMDEIASNAARLAFSGSAKLSNHWGRVINDFEHADEEVVLISIYEDIRNGNYQFE